MPTNETLTSWHAADWEELSDIWEGLVGSSEIAAQPHSPTFRTAAISSRQAGYVFQTWIIEAFRLSSADIDSPYSVPINPGIDDRTQCEIDGLLVLESKGWLIESKFERVDFSPIARLHLLADARPVGTMGLLFAALGFTPPALDSAHILRPMRVLLFDDADINYAVDNRDMASAVRIKWKLAAKYGRPNLRILGRDEGGASQ